ncbi:hypothetical protein LCGC14_0429270 [marine sediment metagenome]|uniref:Uncharacterized protein n=1 Tax=marine sediment metagenome TaxID=412755 RepID=A0A0F9SUU1_9ZZZZ
MARLLVFANGPDLGQISVAKPDGWVFGTMEDKAQYRLKHGNVDDWPDTFVIVDLEGLSIEEATALADPIVTYRDGPIDLADGLPKQIITIHHNSKGLIDFDAMVNTGTRIAELADDGKVQRNVGEVRAHIVERKSG